MINVNFGGFRRAVNYVGGVYVDVDRRYYNDNTTAAPGEAYATIDVQPGYQKLKGQDALDYVRYRHGDNDFFRATRQQDFLRQISHQDAVRALLDVEQAQGARAHLRPATSRSTSPSCSASNLIGLAKTGLFLTGKKAPVNEVRFPAYEAKNPAIDSYLYVKDSDAAQDVRRVHDRQGLLEPAPRRGGAARQGARRRPSRRPSATSRRRSRASSRRQTEGENMAVIVESQGKLGFPFYFPALRKTGSRYADTKPRVYGIRDGQNKLHRAYRLTLYAGAYGEYYGVQGMSWRFPPILDDPDRVARRRRPQADALLRRQPPAARRLADREGRLLGHEHADDVDPELAADRDRGLAAAPEVLAALAVLAVAGDLDELAVAGVGGLDHGVDAGAAAGSRPCRGR